MWLLSCRLTPLFFLLTLSLSVTRASEPLSPREVYQQTLHGTAWVNTTHSTGSGWILDRGRRLLVTCSHVVGDEDSVEVTFPAYRDGKLIAERVYYRDNRAALRESGRIVAGRVLSRDRGCDLALIELAALPDDVQALPLAADSPSPGDEVHTIGNRRDIDALWIYSAGAVRQVYRTREGYPWQGTVLARGATVVVTQAPLNEGDSGGPIVNEHGELVAVAAGVRWQAQLASIAIDVSEVRAFVARSHPPSQPTSAPPRPAGERRGGREVYERALRGSAWVRMSATGARASGWLLDRERRLLLTTCQAIDRQDVVTVVFPVFQQGKLVVEADSYATRLPVLQQGGQVVRGCVLARDKRRDLALVEVDAVPEGTKALPLAAASAVPGQRLHSLENTEGAEALWLYSRGAVRQVARLSPGNTDEDPVPTVLVAQLPLHGDNAGAPLLDDNGCLVGVTTEKEVPQQLAAYCTDVSEVRAFVTEARPWWDPHTVAELRARAACYTRTRRYDRALADCNAALRLDPTAAVYCDRAHVQRLRGDHERALADAQEALRLDPHLTAAHCERAATFNNQGDPEKALTECQAALRLDPDCAAALDERAEAHRRRGDLQQALADCDRALWLAPNLASACWHRGLVFLDRNDPERAALNFTRAIEFDPQLASAYQLRGDANRLQNDLKAALADYTQALELEPHDAVAAQQRGLLLSRKGEADRALADFGEAVRGQPALMGRILVEVRRRGEELTERGEPATAAAWYRASLEALRPGLAQQPELQQRVAEVLQTSEGERGLSALHALVADLSGSYRK